MRNHRPLIFYVDLLGFACGCGLGNLRKKKIPTVIGVVLTLLVFNGCQASKIATDRPRSESVKVKADAKRGPHTQRYDDRFISKIEGRWWELADAVYEIGDHQPGAVMVRFKLWSDGTIRDVKIVNQTVDKLLALTCIKALQELSPVGKWPEDMVREVKRPYRDIKFTFYFNVGPFRPKSNGLPMNSR